MRSTVLALPVVAGISIVSAAQPPAAPRTLRVDYYHTGGGTAPETFALDAVVVEPAPWPGPPGPVEDTLRYGAYGFDVRDSSSTQLLYSAGFGSIYDEWATTEEAKAVPRTFHESVRFPAPTAPVTLTIRKRRAPGSPAASAASEFSPVWTVTVDPKDMFVDTAAPEPDPGAVLALEIHGDPARKVDLLLLGDGYTAAERGKFEADARRLVDILFATSPFRERRTDFNVWGLAPASRESGISRPSQGIHRASPVGATYDAFGSERYVLTFDNKAFRGLASYAPYDVVEIVTNTRTYGGGGIYNLYSTVAVDNAFAPYVFVHEFGHHFAALADEYYTSPVAYVPSATREEPWEPNVTADPASPKWKDQVEAGTPLPTPWGKQEYEIRSRAAQATRAQIRKQNRPEADMEALFAEEQQMDQRQFPNETYVGKVGAFEGARYEAQGLYRPEVDCIMFTRSDRFCEVCRRAISRAIDTHAR
ncbi:MAG: IgA Peptidase M64 [Acidobacteriota bacterium]|nr:IgA Peptidase M64 [Acidobacteriota bacterium]